MAKKDQKSSWEHKRYRGPQKNEEKPVPEIQHASGSRRRGK